VSFDIANGSYDDYTNAYADLSMLGFKKVLTALGGPTVSLPTTTCAGEFAGSSAASVRDLLCAKVQAAFQARRLVTEIFISVGGDWTWGHRKTSK
jgi:hypothetical protein